jgi:hypothetical protein
MPLEIKDIFAPLDQQTSYLILLEQKNGGDATGGPCQRDPELQMGTGGSGKVLVAP